jgi:hypothetical protein
MRGMTRSQRKEEGVQSRITWAKEDFCLWYRDVGIAKVSIV